MSSRCSRIDGGAYRRYKQMVAWNCKPPKDRSKARKRPEQKRRKEAQNERPNEAD